jgi:transposase-like protein
MKESYFQSIREYMPQDAQAALDRQLPVIRQQVQQEIVAFGDSLRSYVEAEVAAATKRQQDELSSTLAGIKTLLEGIKTAPDSSKVDSLASEIDAFEQKYRGLGESTRSLVKDCITKAIPAAQLVLGA